MLKIYIGFTRVYNFDRETSNLLSIIVQIETLKENPLKELKVPCKAV